MIPSDGMLYSIDAVNELHASTIVSLDSYQRLRDPPSGCTAARACLDHCLANEPCHSGNAGTPYADFDGGSPNRRSAPQPGTSAPPHVSKISSNDCHPLELRKFLELPPPPDSNCPFSIPPGGISGVTSPRFYFLSEIGGPSKLACFLDEVRRALVNGSNGGYHSGATLVIDDVVQISDTLVIPPEFTLAGVGLRGRGIIDCTNLPPNKPAIRIPPLAPTSIPGTPFVATGHATIRDLRIEGIPSINRLQAGIDVDGALAVLDNVRVAGLFVGIHGRNTTSVRVDGCELVGNHYGVLAGSQSTHWRIVNTSMTNHRCWGAYVRGASNDVLITGCRFEQNAMGGLLLGAELPGTPMPPVPSGQESVAFVMIEHNRFEGNANSFTDGSGKTGTVGVGLGIRINEDVLETRIFCNTFSTNRILNFSKSSRAMFNTTFGGMLAEKMLNLNFETGLEDDPDPK